MNGLTLVTASTVEPVTLAEAKAFLRVDGATEEDLITSLISAARRFVETYTGRLLLDQTWEITLDRWPTVPRSGPDSWWDGTKEGPASSLFTEVPYLDLPIRPLFEMVSIKTLDEEDEETTFDLAGVVLDRPKARIKLRSAVQWPTPRLSPGGIKVRFRAGYGALAANVPADISQAVLILVGHWFESRELAGTAPAAVKNILDQYRILHL